MDVVNLIIIVDYGIVMYNLSIVLDLYEFLFLDYFLWILGWVYFLFNIINVIGVYNSLKKVEKQKLYFNVYRKEEFLEEFYFKYSRFVVEINVILEEGWLVIVGFFNYFYKVVIKGIYGWYLFLLIMYFFFLV